MDILYANDTDNPAVLLEAVSLGGLRERKLLTRRLLIQQPATETRISVTVTVT